MIRFCSCFVFVLCLTASASLPPLLAEEPQEIFCEGVYKHHLQGVCADDEAIYWSFTTTLVKTDHAGKRLLSIPVANHHGDLCWHDGKVFVAVNLGKFNQPAGKADSWVYVYAAETLQELSRHPVQEAVHGAGGIGFHDGHFFVVGGLPENINENYVFEYDDQFRFVKKHVIESGHTHLGIQTATFAKGRWWFGCYGSPAPLLVTDPQFKLLGRYQYNCSLGIENWHDQQLLSATGRNIKDKGCTGSIRFAVPDEQTGLRLLSVKKKEQ